MKKTLKIIASVVLVVPALLYLYRLFSSTSVVAEKSPNEEKRKKAEKELSDIKKQVDEIKKKEYTDEEIIQKLTKKH